MNSQVSTVTPSGDVGLGDISVKVELGSALQDTIRGSAKKIFRNVALVDTRACASGTEALLDVSLPIEPYVQVHWRDQTPRVGGGTIAEIVVRVIHRDCTESEIGRAVAFGFGREENLQGGANWPNEEDFRPGVDRALEDLDRNLTDLFRDVARALAEP